MSAGPFEKMKVVLGSATTLALDAPYRNTGIPAACSGVHTFSRTAFEPMTTAATLSAIIWFAQSVPLPGSARSTHRSSSMGWPPAPPK